MFKPHLFRARLWWPRATCPLTTTAAAAVSSTQNTLLSSSSSSPRRVYQKSHVVSLGDVPPPPSSSSAPHQLKTPPLTKNTTAANSPPFSPSSLTSSPSKLLLDVSAAATFKGDPNLPNPEDLMLAAITSCHMMSYLYVCEREGITVVSYRDESVATLELNPADGGQSGAITKVELRPVVTVLSSKGKGGGEVGGEDEDAHDSEQRLIRKAISLHERANKLCFIANSCKFKVCHAGATCSVVWQRGD